MYKSSNDLRFTKNRDALQRAYIDLVREKRSTKITVKELTQRAHVNRMTFYSHYESTNDILSEITDGMTEEILAGQAERESVDIASLLNDATAVMQREIDFFRLVAMDESMDLCREKFRAAFRRIFIEELARGGSVKEAELQLAADIIASGVSYAFFDWLSGEFEGMTLDELAGYLEHFVTSASQAA